MIREEDYMEAALLAFKLNKLRDFYHVLNKILSKKDKVEDQVDSVVSDMRKFESISKNDFTEPQSHAKNKCLLSKIVEKLL